MTQQTPIPMILHCPACRFQHVDSAEPHGKLVPHEPSMEMKEAALQASGREGPVSPESTTALPTGYELWSAELIYRAMLAASPVAPVGAPTDPLKAMEARKEAAYLERNKVVALLARVFPSGVARTAIEGWSEDWHGCVYIDLPAGQASWHFHDSQAWLFDGLPAYTKPWDGHDTNEKYHRVLLSRQGCELATDATKQPHLPKGPQ